MLYPFVVDGSAPCNAQISHILREFRQELQGVVGQGVALIKVQKLQVDKLTQNLSDMCVIQSYEFGQFQPFEILYLFTYQLHSMLIQLFTAAEKQSVDVLFIISQKDRHLSVGNRFRAC